MNVGTGLLQQQLTRKIVNTDVDYLGAWASESVDLIDDVLNDDFETSGDHMALASASLMLPTRSDPDLNECLLRLSELKTKIDDRASRFHTLTAPWRAPSFWRRRWLYVLLACPFVLYGVKLLWGERGEIPKYFAKAIQSTREFFSEHVVEPSKAIWKELIWNEHESITDVAALQDAKQSLTRMLEDFLRDTDPKMPERERKAVAESMDMSVVSGFVCVCACVCVCGMGGGGLFAHACIHAIF